MIKYKPMHAEPRPHELPTCAVFSHTEDFGMSLLLLTTALLQVYSLIVIMGEERNNNIHCWEARTGELHRPLKSSNALFVVWHSHPQTKIKGRSGYTRLLFLYVELGAAFQSINTYVSNYAANFSSNIFARSCGPPDAVVLLNITYRSCLYVIKYYLICFL